MHDISEGKVQHSIRNVQNLDYLFLFLFFFPLSRTKYLKAVRRGGRAAREREGGWIKSKILMLSA